MSPPGHFSAGVGQEPQPPALAPLPLPALHSLSGWYKIPGWSNSSRYEPDATGKMALQEQRVETTTKRPGGEVVETNIYANVVAAQIRGGSNAPRIREQRVVDR